MRARARPSDNERTWGMFSILQCLPFPAAAVVIRFLWEDRTMKTYDEVNRSKSWSVLVGNRKQDKNCIHPHTHNLKIGKTERCCKNIAFPFPSFTDKSMNINTSEMNAALFSSK